MTKRAPAIPLARVADAWLRAFAAETGAGAIAALDGAALLGERARLARHRVPGRVSAGGGCRLHATADGEIALNLSRADDHALLPAWLEVASADGGDDALAAVLATRSAAALVERGREMGLALAAVDEAMQPSAGRAGAGIGDEPATSGAGGGRRGPRVLDLSALWAGPLAGRLLALAGGDVLKLESRSRPDAMRGGAPAFYRLLNGGKREAAIDFADTGALHEAIAAADIVIEAARPRALRQLGIDADALVAARPELVWITITAHGMTGEAAGWIGFGDDVGIAAGLGAALRAETGRAGFVGDAIADPLTGVRAALVAWRAWTRGAGGRHDVAMRATVAAALATARHDDAEALGRDLRAWAAAEGARIGVPARAAAQHPGEFTGGDVFANLSDAAVHPFGIAGRRT